MAVTYFVDRMRVTRPTGKTRERNPERVYTVNGIFYSTTIDDAGNLVPKDKLSIPSKNIDIDDVQSFDFALDVRNGFVTLPEGKRGRTASVGLSEDEIFAELAYLRGEENETETEEIETETETTSKSKSK
jgi:hypothetical protein